MKQMLTIAGLAIIMASCNTNYEKTKSGLVYKIFEGKGSGTPIKAGMFAKLNIEYKLSPKDTVLNSTYGKLPLFTAIDTGAKTDYSFMELLPKCKQGDSVIFTISVDSLKNKGAIPAYNEMFKRGDQIKCKMSVLKTFASENEIKADYEKEMVAEKDREIKSIKDYLAKKGVKATQTTNGVFVELTAAGDAQKAQNGKVASIMYKGYLQEDGKVFDTNMDSSKGHTAPIDVAVGKGAVIPGWEEALPYFGRGGRGKIYIPAMLGYGPQGSQGAIPPFANLVFDIEVRDVKDAPKQQPSAGAQPGGMNSLTPEQMQQLQQQMQQQRGQQQGAGPQQKP